MVSSCCEALGEAAAATFRSPLPSSYRSGWSWDGEAPSKHLCAHRIKSKKENQRRVEEQRMLEMAEQRGLSPGEGASETLAQLQLEERRVEKAKEKQQRHKERARYNHVPPPCAEPGPGGTGEHLLPPRYLEALRAQLKEKVKLCHIDLPPLCSCGSSFWDSHPDTCANNCIFYKNHKGRSPSGAVPAGKGGARPEEMFPCSCQVLLCLRLTQPLALALLVA